MPISIASCQVATPDLVMWRWGLNAQIARCLSATRAGFSEAGPVAP